MNELTVVVQVFLVGLVVGFVVWLWLDRRSAREEASWRDVVEIPGDHERLP